MPRLLGEGLHHLHKYISTNGTFVDTFLNGPRVAKFLHHKYIYTFLHHGTSSTVKAEVVRTTGITHYGLSHGTDFDNSIEDPSVLWFQRIPCMADHHQKLPSYASTIEFSWCVASVLVHCKARMQ